ncbi:MULTISPECIES: cation-translocating P-type ATPase [unclassified Imperialibacter]|uniref:cation-translocating P-type ATPase n=1 Tax=unclassified Imperialibacter TaxID=2629706 RepID=UPI0012589ECD|nr:MULTISPECIES: cation-translocating P-type ATPase [unclassified Imperialibacter]CAD5253378.1 Haloacid dehalogenase [Imperialibacter sp. 75]CAD5285375.1 Haloacid dehalogenase [Imperialibacter sp. 89]VVT23248.1 Haloacid dehalogenase [Imperialibacter sp. EC-SDR9]
MASNHFNIQGLSSEEVLEARKKHGANTLNYKKESGLIEALKSIAAEPMVVLLLAVSSIYFFTGNLGDGLFLAAAIVLVAGISLYQDSRSRNALEKLKNFSQPMCKVIRGGETTEIKSEELVVGDSLMIEEGNTIAADGIILHSNDFSVNESILTGESMAVYKDATKEDNKVSLGTTVASGLAVVTVTAIGNATNLGKIGKSLEDIAEEKTPLEKQIANFVKKMVLIGAIVFLIVWAINYFQSYNVLDSLLKALTLAMSILPEEIPVAFTTFMALGAWRLMKLGIVVKQMKTVETLGSATVICTDKTGTLTENKMSLARLFVLSSQDIVDASQPLSADAQSLVRLAMWASEPIPFDPMEVALHEAYGQFTVADERPAFKMIHEYPLGGKPPMMTHIFEDDKGTRIVAAKGAPEAMIAVSGLSTGEKEQVHEAIDALAKDGFRVLGVGEASFNGNNFPATQQEFPFAFKGLVAFYDPPKKNIPLVLEQFYGAGIKVKIVTGDNALTTGAIARQVGFHGFDKSMSGDELMQLTEDELREKVEEVQVFTRMFPEAKLKIINALKARNEIVAMTGDGVNDGPALKAAHIGIAMGKKGTEIAKQAASLILLEDDLSKMVEAVAMGRKIYTNLKKAIQYIISIHIPIILTVFLPLALGWIYPNIFSPLHIILLELIMGPTCSIIYENEPLEKNTMIRKPRPFSSTFFNSRELTTSVVQGLAITAGTLLTYQLAVHAGANEGVTRTMVFVALISSNIFLTLVNRSFFYSVLTTLKYKNNLVPLIIGVTVLILGLLLFVPPLTRFFGFESLGLGQLGTSGGVGFLFVIWFEVVKWGKRRTALN